ncbi:hypothetical protein BGZ95_001770, partial [Linnemannia exigua]
MSIFEVSPRCLELQKKLIDFVNNDCLPAEEIYESQVGTGANRWTSVPPIMEDLKAKAKSLGLWNLFLPKSYPEGPGLTNLEYATLCEITGRCPRVAPEALNCSAPDTGNMEVFAKYGTAEQKAKWLVPLMKGEIRSAFAMTEIAVSSSDATNIETSIEMVDLKFRRPPLQRVLGLGQADPNNEHNYRQQLILIVPADTPGVEIVRPMMVFG